MPFQNPIVGGTTLVRSAIKSPNYQTGVSGWTINADGSAEFTDLSIGGNVNSNIKISFTDGSYEQLYAGAYQTTGGSVNGTWFALQPKTVAGQAWHPGSIGTQVSTDQTVAATVITSPWNGTYSPDVASQITFANKGDNATFGAVIQAQANTIVLNDYTIAGEVDINASGVSIFGATQSTTGMAQIDVLGTDVSVYGLTSSINSTQSLTITPVGTGVQSTNKINGQTLYIAPTGITPGVWTNIPALQNGWTNAALGAGYPPNPQYMVDMFGWVTFRGQIKRASGTTLLAFTMPAGLRPLYHGLYAVGANNGSDVMGRFMVNNTGGMVPNTNYSGFISLDGLRYLAEQ